jgi:Ca2+-binding RTX toxin-like protein
MATFTILSQSQWTFADVIGGTIVARGAKFLEYTSHSGLRVVVRGSGFRYDDAGTPIAGNVTAMDIHDGTTLSARYRDLVIGLVEFHALCFLPADPPDGVALFQALRQGDDLIEGDEVASNLPGFDGNDTIRGNGGDDWMAGGRGIDVLDGGAGNNGVYFEDAFQTTRRAVVVDLARATGNIRNDGWGNVETALNVGNVGGTRWADRISGNATDNRMYGEAGQDTLVGRGGHDVLSGGDGDDTLDGGDGDDTLIGGAGNDSQNGGAGHDAMAGGAGVDRLDGSDGYDALAFWDVDETGHGVSVDLGLGSGQVLDDGYGNVETVAGFEYLFGSDYGDSLVGNSLSQAIWGDAGNDTLKGDNGLDSLYGGDGRDFLSGGLSADTIVGGAGDDRLSGGGQGDHFHFMGDAPGDDGVDRIVDYFTIDDCIVVNRFWADDLPVTGHILESQWQRTTGATVATNASHRFIFAGGTLYFDPDGKGGVEQVAIVTIAGGGIVGWTDILVTDPF